jgi:hypothetical protein
MWSVQSFKWPHFVSVIREDFLISRHIYSAAYMHIHNYVQQYMECERGGGGGDRTPEAIWGLWGMGGGGCRFNRLVSPPVLTKTS